MSTNGYITVNPFTAVQGIGNNLEVPETHLRVIGTYQDGSPALQLFDAVTGEPWHRITFFHSGRPHGLLLVKHWGENAGLVEALIAQDLLDPQRHLVGATGFVNIYAYEPAGQLKALLQDMEF